MQRRCSPGERLFEPPAALVLRRAAQVASADGDRVEGDKRRRYFLRQLRDPRGRRVQPQLQRVEVEPARRRDHDLAVDHAAVRQGLEQDGMQFREVAIERPQIAALDEDLGAAAKDDGAKAVPLRLVEVRSDREIAGELGEHRLDRRLDGKAHGRAGGAGAARSARIDTMIGDPAAAHRAQLVNAHVTFDEEHDKQSDNNRDYGCRRDYEEHPVFSLQRPRSAGHDAFWKPASVPR